MDYDFSQNSGFEFLDLQGACKAEIEILHNMLFNSQENLQAQNLFHLKPNSNGEDFLLDLVSCPDADNPEEELNMSDESPNNVAEIDPPFDAHPVEVAVDVAEVPNPMQNGPDVALSPHHQVPLDPGAGDVPMQNEMNPNMMSQGPPHHNIRSYYAPQQLTVVHGSPQVSTAGPVPTHGHMSVVNQNHHNVPIPASVAMYHHANMQMQQMIQAQGGTYGVPVGIQQIHNGPPHGHGHQHGSQPHTVYYLPSEPISPEAVHLQNSGQSHHKGHHDHHSVASHSPNNPGQGGQGGPNSYGRKTHRRPDMRRNEEPLMNKYPTYYPHVSYANMHYYSHQQLAQNVTGPPIIMAAHNSQHPAGIFGSPYQHQHTSHLYTQAPSGNEMDQHHGNMGLPQSAAQIPNEIPQFAQHQPSAPPMYHGANMGQPNNNRTGYANRGINNPLPEQNIEQPEVPVEKPVESEVVQISEASTQPLTQNGISVNVEEMTQESSEVAKEEVSRVSPVSICHNKVEPVPVVNGEASPSSTVVSTSVAEPRSKEKSYKNKNPATDIESKIHVNKDSVVKYLMNGEVSKQEKDKVSKSRDKPSADVVTAVEGIKAEVKSKSASGLNGNNNGRSVNVTNNTTPNVHLKCNEKSETVKEIEGSGSQEFPQLAKMPNGPTPVAPVKGRSWASIASSKTPNSTSIDCPPSRTVIVHNQDYGSVENAHVNDTNGNKFISTTDNSLHVNTIVPIAQDYKTKSSANLDFPPDISSLTDENDPIALRLGDFLANYVLDHHSLALTPRGLSNQSNFCYINATLQALLSCPPFVNLFRALRDILSKKPCKATPIIQSVFDFVNEFEPMIRGNNNKRDRRGDAFCTGANLEPVGIRKVLGLLEGSTFKVEGRQEDAEEFLSHILNALHDEMIKVIKWAENRKERLAMKNITTTTVNIPAPVQMNGQVEDVNRDEDDEDQWQVMGPKNKGCLTRKTSISKSPISETFLGQMCSALHRINSTTSLKSATLQPFYTLQLDIQNEGIRSVRDALEGLSAKEEVSGFISATGVEMEAWRQLSLDDLPMVLILHLKRFVYEKTGNKIQKVDKKLDFGIDLEIGKDLLSINSKSKYTSKQRQYKLFSVVYHDGEEAHKGHYVADCFHPSGGSMWGQCGWLRFDDTAVKQIPESQMLVSQPPRVPYLLYYRRADTLLSHVTPNQQKKERA